MDIYEITGCRPDVGLDQVMRGLGCAVGSPAYEDMAAEYEEIRKQIPAMVYPVGILGFSRLPDHLATNRYGTGVPVAMGVLSVGRAMEEESGRQFRQGNYVKGMLWDAVANVALFSLEKDLTAALRECCRSRRVGVERRLEAPHDISMDVQREAWSFLELEKRYGIHITQGNMLDPVKTSCQVFVLTDREDVFRAGHDCKACGNLTCQYRKEPGEAKTARQES